MQDPGLVQRFATEVAAIAELDHPNIAKAYDAGTVGDVPYLAMEFVDGPNVGRICSEDRLSLPVACEITRQSAIGLSYAHEQGFAHRDIKPGNLMLTGDGQVKSVDFGLARVLKEDQYLTDTNVFVGTLAFAAPEQLFDNRNITASADVYSLGCSLFYFLVGKSPFECRGNSLARRWAAKKMIDFSSLHVRDYDQSIPPELDELVAEMISPEPQSRPSASEVSQRLATWAETGSLESLAADFSATVHGQPLTVADKQVFDAATATPVSHSRRTLLLGGLAGCAVAGSLGTLAWMSQEPSNMVSTNSQLVTVYVETVPPECPITWIPMDMGEPSIGRRYLSRGGEPVDLPPGEYIIEWQRPGNDRCYAMRSIPTVAQQGATLSRFWGYLSAKWDDVNRFFELIPLRTVGGKPPRLKRHGHLLVSDLITDKRFRKNLTGPFADIMEPPNFDPGEFAAITFIEATQFAMSFGCRLLSHKELLSLGLNRTVPEWTTTWPDIDSTSMTTGGSYRKILHPESPRVVGRMRTNRYCFRMVQGMPQ